MINVSLTAQQILDAYYQDVQSAEDSVVIDIGYVINEVLSARNFLIGQEFLEQRKLDVQLMGDDYELTTINSEWYEPFKVDVKYDEVLKNHYADLPVNVFSFPYDKWGVGINNIIPLGQCNELLRIRLNMAWVVCEFDVTQDVVSWYQQGKTVRLLNLDFNCIRQAIIYLIPSYDDCFKDGRCTAVIPDAREYEIKKMVTTSMFDSFLKRLGKISTTSDGNPNPTNESSPINSLAN